MKLSEVSFDEAITALKQNGARFANVYRDFMNAEYWAKQNPQLYAQWKHAKEKADFVKNTIVYINSKVEGSINWFSNVFGLNGVNALAGINQNQNLGLLPLVPVAYVLGASAAVIGAISLMSNSMANIYEYKRKADLVEQGQADPDILNQEDKNTLSSQLSGVLKFGLVLVAAYYIVPKLMKKS
jgi:hypothetical protein